MPRQPLRKADVEVLESMERGLRGGIVIEDETLERLLKLGLVEEKKRGIWSLTVRARTYLLRRKSLKRGKKAAKAAPGSGAMGQ